MRGSLFTHRPGLQDVGGAVVCAAMVFSAWAPRIVQGAAPAKDSVRLTDVRTFGDNVLKYGRDTYGPRHTPLFVDGINIDTHRPATWELPPDCAKAWGMPEQWIMSDLACQQVLFRVLDILTTLTGDAKYRQAAIDAFRYHFEHLQHEDGLLYWGGHAMVDAATEQPVGESYKDWRRNVPVTAFWDVGIEHELKHQYPCYDLMWQADPQATRRFIEGFWSAHILRWDNLDFNRHGLYGRAKPRPWDHEFVGGPVPFKSKGLTLLDTGCDLMYAAVQLYRLSGDPEPLVWAKRLAKRYADVCDPRTGLGPDIYGDYRNEKYIEQFGPEFGERFTETTQVSEYGIRYGFAAVCQLQLAAQLGPEGDEFKEYAVGDLTALARHLYDPQDNQMWCMLTDGTKLGPADVKRAGILAAGDLHKRSLGPMQLWAYALAYRLTKDPLMWDMARRIAKASDLGDIGEPGGGGRKLNTRSKSPGVLTIFALLEFAGLTGDKSFLETARTMGDDLIEGQFDRGFFVSSKKNAMCEFDTTTPLALLHLDIALRGLQIQPPKFFGNDSFFLCPYEGQGRAYSGTVFDVKR